MNPNPKTPGLVCVASEKGGVGKTSIAKGVLEIPKLRNGNIAVHDTETGAGDLARVIHAKMSDIGSVKGQMQVLDNLSGLTLVDLRAGKTFETLRAFQETRLLDDIKAGSLQLALVHVLEPSERSMREVAEVSSLLRGCGKHFLVFNHVNEGGFDDWVNDGRFATQLQKMEGVTLKIPHLTADAMEAVQMLGVGFGAFIRDNTQSRTLRGYVRSWLDTVAREVDRVGLGDMIAAAVG